MAKEVFQQTEDTASNRKWSGSNQAYFVQTSSKNGEGSVTWEGKITVLWKKKSVIYFFLGGTFTK